MSLQSRGCRCTVVWAAGAAFALTTAAAAPPAPPCSATASFDTERGVVGQQLHHRIRIERRADVGAVEWIDPPTFPGFRAEWLPAPPGTDATPGVHFEHRALFPERAGRIATAPARLRCRVESNPDETLIDVAPALIQIDAAPDSGRPPGFVGLIGPITIDRIVTPKRIALGESVRVAVMLRGRGNLWDADDPLPAIAAADVFRRRPETTLETAREITVKRHFHYDVVPLAAGEVMLPPLQIDFFDPVDGRYGTAAAAAVAVQVEPVSNTVSDGASAEALTDADAGPPTPTPQPEPKPSRWLAAGIAGCVAAVAVLGWRLWRRKRDASHRATTAFADARDPTAALSRALRTAIERHLPGSGSATPEELTADGDLRGPVGTAVQLLAELERARFDPNAPRPDPATIHRAIRAL